jgi:hypothetical protein
VPLETHRRDVGCTGAEIPPPWSATILACLAKNPANRPAPADEVASRLGVTLEPLVTSATRLSSPVAAAAPSRRSLVPWLAGLGGVLVAFAAAGIYLGIYLPEQKRLAAEQVQLAIERERAHQAELARQAERARQAEEQQRLAEEKRKAAELQAIEERRKEEEARAKMVRDQQAFSTMLAQIAALSDNALPRQITEVQRAVRTNVRTAPEKKPGTTARPHGARARRPAVRVR